MNIQRLRNLTTGRLHTEMGHIYEDLEYITGMPGIMTHMIPRVYGAINPWLRTQVKEERFWNGEWDATHIGEYQIRQMTPAEQAEMLYLYFEQPDPLAGKDVIEVHL